MDKHLIRIDEEGRICLSPDLREKYGIRPGTEAVVEEGKHSFLVHTPASMLGRIYVEPTSRCNLECSTCIRQIWKEPLGEMEPEVFSRILDALGSCDPVPELFFGGFGEPLSHPDIINMISSGKRYGAGTEIISNGVLLDEHMIGRLIDAGLDFLWISIDGATPESYADVRLGNMLPEIIKNLKILRRMKYQRRVKTPGLGISFVAMKRNIHELPQLMELASNLDAEKLMVSNVLPYSDSMLDEILYSRSMGNWKYHTNQIALPRIDTREETWTGLKKLFSHYELSELTGREFSKPYDTCPFIERGSVSVRFDGSVSPCLPLLHRHTSYLGNTFREVETHFFGSLREQRLLDIWNNEAYTTFRTKVKRFDFSPCTTCNSCEMAEGNREDCFGSVPLTCGGCLWAQGFIQCP